MAGNVPILDLLKNPKQYGNVTNLFVDYNPDEKQIELTSKKTGVHYSQKFKTEKNMTWRPLLYSRKKEVKAYLLGYVTNDKLALKGEVGYKNGVRCMHIICKECYSNKKLGLEAKPLTMKVWDHAESNVKYGYYSKKFYLAERASAGTYGNYYSGYMSRGFHVTGKGGLEIYATYKEVAYLDNEDEFIEFPLVPVIPLPDDMMVRIEDPTSDGSTPEKGLKLVLPYKSRIEKKEENSKTMKTSEGIDVQALENYALSMLESAKSMEKKANEMLEQVKKLKENKT